MWLSKQTSSTDSITTSTVSFFCSIIFLLVHVPNHTVLLFIVLHLRRLCMFNMSLKNRAPNPNPDKYRFSVII